MKYITTGILIAVLCLVPGCGNKIVVNIIDQNGSERNSIQLDGNTLDTDDSFETDSQAPIELDLPLT